MKIDTKSYSKHANHQMMIDERPVAHNIASLRCISCNKHVKWLSRDELTQIKSFMAPHYGKKEGVKTRPVRKSTARHLR